MNQKPSSKRKIGYARVSTDEQELHLQLDALREAGCAEKDIFTDKASGAKASRPGLDACLQQLRAGDVLLVWKLDRLGRSLQHLVNLVADLRNKGISLKSITDGIDTTTAQGSLFFGLFATLSEFERSLITERTNAGLAAARARGRLGGRRPIPANDPRIQTAKALHVDKNMPVADICKTLKISRATLYRYLARN